MEGHNLDHKADCEYHEEHADGSGVSGPCARPVRNCPRCGLPFSRPEVHAMICKKPIKCCLCGEPVGVPNLHAVTCRVILAGRDEESGL